VFVVRERRVQKRLNLVRVCEIGATRYSLRSPLHAGRRKEGPLDTALILEPAVPMLAGEGSFQILTHFRWNSRDNRERVPFDVDRGFRHLERAPGRSAIKPTPFVWARFAFTPRYSLGRVRHKRLTVARPMRVGAKRVANQNPLQFPECRARRFGPATKADRRQQLSG